jgi:hypothetical protein
MLSRAPFDITRCVSTPGISAVHSKNVAASCGELDPEMPTTSRRGSPDVSGVIDSVLSRTTIDHAIDQPADLVCRQQPAGDGQLLHRDAQRHSVEA